MKVQVALYLNMPTPGKIQESPCLIAPFSSVVRAGEEVELRVRMLEEEAPGHDVSVFVTIIAAGAAATSRFSTPFP